MFNYGRLPYNNNALTQNNYKYMYSLLFLPKFDSTAYLNENYNVANFVQYVEIF